MPLFSSSFKLEAGAPRSAFISAPRSPTREAADHLLETASHSNPFSTPTSTAGISQTTPHIHTSTPPAVFESSSSLPFERQIQESVSPLSQSSDQIPDTLGLHRDSTASEHPFEEDTEDEADRASVGRTKRGSSASVAASSLKGITEEDEANNQSSTRSIPGPHPSPPIIVSQGASPTSPPPLLPSYTPPSGLTHTRRSTGSTNMDRSSSPGSPSGGNRLRVSASPARHHHGLTALSPLQGLSPLQPTSRLPGQSPGFSRSRSVTGGLSESTSGKGSLGGHSRQGSGTGSLSRSLSRRQSLYNAAASWQEGREYADENLTNPAQLFSKLTLVRAPGESKALRQRSKSSSALMPMGVTAPVDIPATSPRAGRKSFATSFGAMSPITPVRPVPIYNSVGNDATNRISSYGANQDQTKGKNYTPDEVVDMARSLASPVLLPEGGFKGAELKRRKSAGASFGHKSSLSLSSSLSSATSPEKPATALEPVEYVQLDDETLLPYVDRPDEVKDLISHPSNAKMFDMLRAAFPKNSARKNWQEIPPTEWNWDELVLHLTSIDRIECPDYAWVLMARQAVRRRSVALWEKIGVCLGCDDRLLQAGSEEPEGAPTWGGLGGEDDYEPIRGQVWIEGLSPVDPEEAARAESAFKAEFGEIVEDDDAAAAAGMTALLGTIGEGEEENTPPGSGPGGSRPTPAQRAGSLHKRDPMAQARESRSGGQGKGRTKSFVGLTIHSGSIQSPPSFSHGLGMNSAGGPLRSPMFTPDAEMAMPTYDRGPGQALFPTGFSSLSAEPNLGRAASGLVGGIKPQVVPSAFSYGAFNDQEERRLLRRKSGTGLSESAITFASESDWSAGAGHHD